MVTFPLLTKFRRYGTEPFSSVNGQIAQLNLWDDHDVCNLLHIEYIFADL
jgi:hypothetical protein